MAVKEKDKEITFEVVEHIGVIAVNTTGWKKELNYVSWNGNAPKYDIRDWDEEHAHMSKGVTFTKEETKTLYELLGGLEL
ncbi:YdbC family protein [Sinanaerobacter chloroacetimidivorans]|jgi:hypothetical protein|uniref:Transcriptional coactivator p15 (PC4) C-terminal domain-containing protein n=1 Tax=Sinanaerobacter chloroacetimidivorans TaxID=2818044 RepID=A0A8J8B1E1_9FIRM|nr:PC4/YdbC family ssDNA-binding protein [Sinanaerobacter chloroacetimidivorans]MBR0597566.1 hypothetical protein [Sinanaerobacter chloroacetimidivorans]